MTPDIINTSTVTNYSDSYFEGIVSGINSSYAYDSSVSGSYDIFNANAHSGFSINGGINYSNYMGQYYYALQANYERYAFTLPNYSSNLSAYRNNLTQDFSEQLDDLFIENDYEAAEEFYNMYGTHVIAKGIYGGKIETYYSVVSNELDVGGSLRTSITEGINAGVTGVIQAGTQSNFNLGVYLGVTNDQYSDSFRTMAWGGSPLAVSSISNFHQGFSNWAVTIDDNPTLIGTSSDGLIPLWELLPTQYNNDYYKDIMKDLFEVYVSTYNESINDMYNCTGTIPDTFQSDNYIQFRTSVYRITDAGRFVHNKVDVIELENFTFYSNAILKMLGYQTVTIFIKLRMREINDGFQYICLYNNTGKSDNYKVCDDIQYEYSNGSNWNYEYFQFSNIDIDTFDKTKPIVIRYGASGNWADDWENKELQVQVIYNK